MFVRNIRSKRIKKCLATSHLFFTSYYITLMYSEPRVKIGTKYSRMDNVKFMEDSH